MHTKTKRSIFGLVAAIHIAGVVVFFTYGSDTKINSSEIAKTQQSKLELENHAPVPAPPPITEAVVLDKNPEIAAQSSPVAQALSAPAATPAVTPPAAPVEEKSSPTLKPENKPEAPKQKARQIALNPEPQLPKTGTLTWGESFALSTNATGTPQGDKAWHKVTVSIESLDRNGTIRLVSEKDGVRMIFQWTPNTYKWGKVFRESIVDGEVVVTDMGAWRFDVFAHEDTDSNTIVWIGSKTDPTLGGVPVLLVLQVKIPKKLAKSK